MICPKCRIEEQYGNFCSICGNTLREKCRECGNIEQISRTVCETKLAQVKGNLSEYQKHKVGGWRNSATFAAAQFCGLVAAACFLYTLILCDYVSSPLMPLSLSVVGLITWKKMLPVFFSVIALTIWLAVQSRTWQSNALDRAKEEFFRLNPQDAELIKKASEG